MASEAEVRNLIGDAVLPYHIASAVIIAAIVECDSNNWGAYVALSSYASQSMFDPEHVSMPDGASVSFASITQMQTLAKEFYERYLEEFKSGTVAGKFLTDDTGRDESELEIDP